MTTICKIQRKNNKLLELTKEELAGTIPSLTVEK